MWVQYNANPLHNRVGDCTIRAISKALNKPWDEVYLGVVVEGYSKCDMPSANNVWGAYLRKNGFVRHPIPNTCPDCYTVSDFCDDHPNGTFILAVPGHVVCTCDGRYFDTFDSGQEIPVYFWTRKDNNDNG